MFGNLTSNFRPSDCIAPKNIKDRLSELNFFVFCSRNLVLFLRKTVPIQSLEMRTLVSSLKTTFCQKKNGYISLLIHHFEQKRLLFFLKLTFCQHFLTKRHIFENSSNCTSGSCIVASESAISHSSAFQ